MRRSSAARDWAEPQWSRHGVSVNDPAHTLDAGPPLRRLTPVEWLVRHGLWIVLLVIVTTWELLGFIFPVADSVPHWWNHPTVSQEVKQIIGTSLPGRVISTLVLLGLAATLIAHWSWQVF